jgi:hypothetical protein
MNSIVNHNTLHRTAKYFMDSGRALTHDDAVDLLRRFGLTIHVGPNVMHSVDHQTTLLTLVNVLRRTLLGGIEVAGLQDGPSLSPLVSTGSLADAVRQLGGTAVSTVRADWPSAIIGDANVAVAAAPAWRLTWEGWRGGVVPAGLMNSLTDTAAIGIAPALAAAVCAAEVFAYHAGDHLMAGRRAAGMSLWRPDGDWLAPDDSEPPLSFLPSRLWLIGLGNLGQAFAWLLACLPYEDRSQVELLLQDFDQVVPSNHSTSLLSFLHDVGRRKCRMVADWLEERGFVTFLNERYFGPWTRRGPDEPTVAFCGVDNALARAALEKAGFDLVVEAGLGAGPQSFRSFSLHTFPASRSAEHLWLKQVSEADHTFETMPAYKALRQEGMDECGLAQLASRTVGVPFVGLIAALMALSELLRRLHSGVSLELASGSTLSLHDTEIVPMTSRPYTSGHVAAAAADPPR